MIGSAGSSIPTNLSSLKQYTMNSLSAITNRVYAELLDKKDYEMEKDQDEGVGLDLGLGGDDDVDPDRGDEGDKRVTGRDHKGGGGGGSD